MAIEYITKQEALDAVDKRINELMQHPEFVKKYGRMDIDLYGVKGNILDIRPSDVAPVIRGKWI